MKTQPNPPSARRAISLPLRLARLPTADKLLPYLQRIDENRWYTNFGALATAFETRLGEHFGVGSADVTVVANATVGLTVALQALGIAPGSRCILPAFTFAASPASAMNAGLRPYFLDVDRESWSLEPELVESAIANGLTDVGAVMPVSAFGAPIDASQWDAFTARTGIPVVIDAAWAFDALKPAKTPSVVSLHATKVLGIGEGGAVVSTERNFIANIRQLSNFGFDGNHLAAAPGGNYKLSEYAAAVGHAALDEWPERRALSLSVARAYRQAFEGVPKLRLMKWFGESGGATCAVECASEVGSKAIDAMAGRGIEIRLWWGTPCHRHPAYAECDRAGLVNTEWLAPRVLCLPFYAELTKADVSRVRDALVDVCGLR